MRRSARTVLCGGRSAMVVPTATKWIVFEQGTAFGAVSGARKHTTYAFVSWRIVVIQSQSPLDWSFIESRRPRFPALSAETTSTSPV
jgi:hypothetical protein